MEATTNINIAQNKSNVLVNWFNHQADKFEAARFWWMALYIIIQSCLSSIAAAFILQNHADIWMLCSCAAMAMASNAVFIAQGDKKWCLAVFYLSLIVNTVFILVNL